MNPKPQPYARETVTSESEEVWELEWKRTRLRSHQNIQTEHIQTVAKLIGIRLFKDTYRDIGPDGVEGANW